MKTNPMRFRLVSLGLSLALLCALVPGTSWAWQGGAMQSATGQPSCMVWQTVYRGTQLSFNFKAQTFTMRLSNPGWDLPVGSVYPSAIVVDDQQVAVGGFRAQSGTVLEAQFEYARAPGFIAVVKNGLDMQIDFPSYPFETDLNGLYPAFDGVAGCVAHETGGYNPLQ